MNSLNDTYQMMIVNAACHAIAMNQETERMAIAERVRPSTIYRPKLLKDGNQWCALYGENLQDGVAGFGDTPSLAYSDFDKEWKTPLNQQPKNPDSDTKQCPECGHETIFVRPAPHKCRCGYSFIQ